MAGTAKVRELCRQPLLARAVFDGLFMNLQHRQMRAIGTTYTFGKKVLSSPSMQKSIALRKYWLSYLSQNRTASVGVSLVFPKRLSSQPGGVSRFSDSRQTFNFHSFLYYSTRPKPQEQFGNYEKPFEDHDLPSTLREKVTEPISESQPKHEVVNRDVESVESVNKVEHDVKDDVVAEKKPGLFKRFHQAYKQYGKVLIGVHVFTSTLWTGMFYAVAVSGVNVEPFLRWIGAGETIISFYTMPGVGHLAVAYLMYKLATPARYAVTIGGTHLAVRLLTQWGYMTPVPESEKLKSLVKDSKSKVKEKYEKYQDKMDDIRDELKEFTSKEHKLK